jgi:DNA-directed RNA polymerase specialized sigma24 family protein
MLDGCDDDKYEPNQRAFRQSYRAIRDGDLSPQAKSCSFAALVATSQYTFHLLKVVQCQKSVPDELIMDVYLLTVDKVSRTEFPMTSDDGVCEYLFCALRNNAATILRKEHRRKDKDKTGTEDVQDLLEQVASSEDKDQLPLVFKFDDGTLISIERSELRMELELFEPAERLCIEMSMNGQSVKQMAFALNLQYWKAYDIFKKAMLRLKEVLMRKYRL